MDVSTLEPGRDFRKAIEQNVSCCNVVLVLIGPDWLEIRDVNGHRRLEDPNDFVRIEVASALRRDIPVIPVLLRGARMPTADQLPEELRDLAFRNAAELTHARWRSDVQLLFQALRHQLEPAAAPASLQQSASRDTSVAVPSSSTQSPETGDARSGASVISPEAIGRATQELVKYIGPIAEVVLRRAARHANSAEEMYRAAAQEIEDLQQRASFLKALRK